MATYHVLLLLVSYSYAQTTDPRKCHDVNQDACQKFFAKDPTMCSNTCLAKVCQDTCRFCPVTCYHCDDVASPEDCKATVQCSTTNQRCIAAQRYATDYHKFFTSGCTEKELCSALFGFDKREISIDRDGRSYIMHGGCCDTNYCNIHDPENVTSTPDPNSRPPKPSGPNPLLSNTSDPTFDTCKAADLDSDGCRLLNDTDPTMCQNNCLATQFCPKFCGLCSECYDCPKAADPAVCSKRKLCKVNQSCVSVVTLGVDLSVTSQLGCMNDNICSLYFNGGGIGKRQTTLRGSCCKTDLCNKAAALAPGPALG